MAKEEQNKKINPGVTKVIRRSVLSINEANKGKIAQLFFIVEEMTRVVNLFIDSLWAKKDFSSKFVSFKVGTWLSARLQQCLGKQALEIVKSQRKLEKKTKPIFAGKAFNLDSRFVDFQEGRYFDFWIRFSSIGGKIQLRLPAKTHKPFNKFKDWDRSKSIRLVKRHGGFFIEIFFDKKQPEIKSRGKVIGLDCGYKELAVTSDSQHLDDGLEKVYEKISRKKQGSNAFKRALTERNNSINRSLNKIKLHDVRELVVEDLKNIKHKSKGKIFKRFNNKLQRWIFPKVLEKLQQMTEEIGVLFTKVSPIYTSQKCCKCGVICKSNRKGKIYECACGNKIDADLNAAINLSHMGVYSPHALYGNI